jgi:hypothetical protein
MEEGFAVLMGSIVPEHEKGSRSCQEIRKAAEAAFAD